MNKLRPIFSSPVDLSENVDRKLMEGISRQFPIENKQYSLRLTDLRVNKKNFTHEDEKKAILQSSSLTYPIKGDLELWDKTTNKIVDKLKDFTLADSFYLTGKHTLMYKGNNYSVSNLIQLLPGVYSRIKDTGETDAHFNTGSGRSFHITLDPRTEMFYITVESSSTPIAPLLVHVFKIPESEISKYIPQAVWRTNVAKTNGQELKLITAMYQRLVNTRNQDKNDNFETKCTKLREALESSKLHEKTTEVTLGKAFSTIEGEAILRTMSNLVKIHTGERQEDNRDSLQFKRVQNLADFIARRFDEDKSHELVNKATSKLTFNLEKIDPDHPKITDVLPGKPFNKIFTNFLTASSLASTPSETNPIESFENVGKVTILGQGEGGIGSARRVQMSARSIDPSHLGIIDPSRTPESQSAGIDQRFTVSAHRDEAGNMYAKVKDNSGKVHFLSVHEMMTTTVGFPGEEGKDPVYAQVNGKIQRIPRKDVKYWVHDATDLYTVTTNLVPFLNSNHSGRLTMAGKAIPQALSLENREVPLVQTVDHKGEPFVSKLGRVISTYTPVAGTVVKSTNSEVHVKDDEGNLTKIKLVKNLPYNQKGFMDDEAPKVKEGDKVKAGQVIADNNYTRDGKIALGKNLYVAYIPWRGYNHEDGIVIRKGAADDMKSLHAYKYDYAIKPDTTDKKVLFKRYFPGMYTNDQLDKLDDRGFAKPGVTLHHGDPVFAVMEKRELSAEDKIFGRVHKTLINPYRAVVEEWQHDESGTVVDSHTEGKDIRILCRSVKPLEIGDKLTGLHGNKGVVSLIMDDDKMPVSKTTGKPVDVLLNPASVTSRVNLGQVMETVAAKIAAKRGTPYTVKNYSINNNLHTLRKELKEHGISDEDELVDPVTNKSYGNQLAGPQYFLKLYKTTDSNYSARSVGGYDSTLQPSKGGEEGAKKVGYMEFLGLLGSDARHNLREIGTLKSEKNDDFWNKFLTGQPLPRPSTTFATNKFFGYLKAAGINVRTENGKISAAPLRDEEILAMSNGEIQTPKLLAAKDLAPEKKGLFDVALTGGMRGDKWSHYSLAEPIVNPVFESQVKGILGMSTKDYEGVVSGALGVKKVGTGEFHLVDTKNDEVVGAISMKAKEDPALHNGFPLMAKAASSDLLIGGHAFKAMLDEMDVSQEMASAKHEALNAKSISKRDNNVKKLKYLAGFNKQGYDKISDAVILRNVPVLPPVMRPVIPQGANRIEYADMNQLYKDHMLVNNSLKDIIEYLPPETLIQERKVLYDGVKAFQGIGEAINGQSKAKDLKGVLHQISGDGGPKTGFFHDRILSKKQDFSGRATIYAAPDVAFNEAKFPVEMLWSMYRMHIIRDLVKYGHSLPDAIKAYDNRSTSAQNSFKKMTEEVPIILNRAPTLMKTNIMALKAVPVPGKTIGLNILHLPGYAADFDGDALSAYVPMTPEAIKEAKDKLLPQNHLNDARKGHGNPMFAPGHEAILGSVYLTEPDVNQKTVKFSSEEEALQALKEGKIRENTPIEIGEHK